MSQIVAFKREDFGIIFTDSNIIKADNTPIKGENRKVFKGKNFIIATAGLSYGIYIIEGLIKSAKDFDIKDINYLTNYLIKVGNRQYQDFIRGNKNIQNDYLRIYFIVIAVNESGQLSMKMIGAEGFDNFKEFPVVDIITIPRRITIELGLIKKQKDSKEEIKAFIEESLEKIHKIDKSISPPFVYESFEID